eukprot:659167_1
MESNHMYGLSIQTFTVICEFCDIPTLESLKATSGRVYTDVCSVEDHCLSVHEKWREWRILRSKFSKAGYVEGRDANKLLAFDAGVLKGFREGTCAGFTRAHPLGVATALQSFYSTHTDLCPSDVLQDIEMLRTNSSRSLQSQTSSQFPSVVRDDELIESEAANCSTGSQPKNEIERNC